MCTMHIVQWFFVTCAGVFCYMCRGFLLHVQGCFVTCALCRGVLLHVKGCFVTCAGVFCYMCRGVLLHVQGCFVACARLFCYMCTVQGCFVTYVKLNNTFCITKKLFPSSQFNAKENNNCIHPER